MLRSLSRHLAGFRGPRSRSRSRSASLLVRAGPRAAVAPGTLRRRGAGRAAAGRGRDARSRASRRGAWRARLLAWLQARVLTARLRRARRSPRRERFFAHALALPMDFYVAALAGRDRLARGAERAVAETVSADLAHLVLRPRHGGLLPRADAAAGRGRSRRSWRAASRVRARRAGARSTRRTEGDLAALSVQARQARRHGDRRARPTSRASRPAARRARSSSSGSGLQVQFVNTAIARSASRSASAGARRCAGLVAQLRGARPRRAAHHGGRLQRGRPGRLPGAPRGLHGARARAVRSRRSKLQSLRGDLARLDDVLQPRAPSPASTSMRTNPRSAVAGARPGALEFRDVTFGYDRGEAPLVEDFSLTLEARRARRAGGRLGLGQVHARAPRRGALPPVERRDPLRRRCRASRTIARDLARGGGVRRPGRGALRRHACATTSRCGTRRPRTRSLRRGVRDAAIEDGDRRCARAGSTRRCRRARATSPAASASASRSRARSRAAPRSSSSTRRPARSTRRPRRSVEANLRRRGTHVPRDRAPPLHRARRRRDPRPRRRPRRRARHATSELAAHRGGRYARAGRERVSEGRQA